MYVVNMKDLMWHIDIYTMFISSSEFKYISRNITHGGTCSKHRFLQAYHPSILLHFSFKLVIVLYFLGRRISRSH